MLMEKRTLGRTGLEVGIIGLGTEHIIPEPGNADAILDLAVDAGLNYIDLIFNDLFADIFEGVGDYWDALGPAIRRHRDDLVLCLHWGTLYEQPLDLCQDAFDTTLKYLGNGFAEIGCQTEPDLGSQRAATSSNSRRQSAGRQRSWRPAHIPGFTAPGCRF